jgi:4-diphosphocytidyl-2-C-methyl-D-erythritol kinase
MIHSEKAYAKINLFLDVLSKRSDGYHDIGTLFQTVNLCDTLQARERADGEVRLTYNNIQDYPVESDLVYRAAQALRAFGGVAQGVDLHLEKVLPLGAGLGGGSADAAAALRLLNRMWNLGLAPSVLCEIGAKLGADVPFLVEGGTCLASGIGEILERVPAAQIPVDGVLVVATPLCAVPTKAAYAGISPSGDVRWNGFRKDLLSKPFPDPLFGKFDLFNKFEESVLPQFPQIQKMKDDFLSAGALGTLMSGSGASVFAFFETEIAGKSALERISSTSRFGAIARFVENC